MIDVILIYLPKPFLKQPDAQAPLGLMYIAASLEKHGKTVQIKNYASYSNEEAIENLPPAKLYGITATSLEIPQAGRFARMMKNKYIDAKIVVGGPGVYAFEGTGSINREGIDSAFYGEGEYAILDVLEDAIKDTMKFDYVGEAIEDLDALPFPARHLLKDKLGGNIFAYDSNYMEGGSTVIISSRGCPFKCAFCSAPRLTHTNKLRFRSPKEVAREMQHVVSTYNIKQFRFSDDMFTAGRKRVFELCEEIGKLDTVWRISCRVKPLDEDMLKAMWDAGCRELSFGIESFDDKVLAGLKKGTTGADNVKALILADKLGFKSRMLFMIRTPFQTPETIKINKYWIQRVPFAIMACTAFVPIPGCDIWYNPDKYNIEILDRDLDKYNFYMFGPEGRVPIEPIIKIKNRNLDEFTKESEEFRDWAYDFGKVNEG